MGKKKIYINTFSFPKILTWLSWYFLVAFFYILHFERRAYLSHFIICPDFVMLSLYVLFCHCMLHNTFCPSCVLFRLSIIMTQKTNLCSVSLGVNGMTCGSCVQSIEQRIGSLPGVIHIKVNAVFKKNNFLALSAIQPFFSHIEMQFL